MTKATEGSTEAKRQRIALRVHPELKDMLERASALSGLSVTAIATRALEAAALEEIKRHQTVRLNAEDSRRFAEILANPPRPIDALHRAARLHRALIADAE